MRYLLVAMTVCLNIYADAYLLIMSKDDGLCQHINKMFNSDLFHHKKLHLEGHEEFNAVTWDKEFVFYDYKTDKLMPKGICDGGQVIGCKNAIFDINNDGKDEMVAYIDERLHGRPEYNSIAYTAQDPKALLEFHFNRHPQFTGNEKLKELPVQETDSDGFKFYISYGNYVLLRPFKIDKTYYIATFFNTDGRDNWNGYGYISKDINDNNMVVIGKYTPDNTMQDICYLNRTFTSRTFNIKPTKKDK